MCQKANGQCYCALHIPGRAWTNAQMLQHRKHLPCHQWGPGGWLAAWVGLNFKVGPPFAVCALHKECLFPPSATQHNPHLGTKDWDLLWAQHPVALPSFWVNQHKTCLDEIGSSGGGGAASDATWMPASAFREVVQGPCLPLPLAQKLKLLIWIPQLNLQVAFD
jgi:hypothetical protein